MYWARDPRWHLNKCLFEVDDDEDEIKKNPEINVVPDFLDGTYDEAIDVKDKDGKDVKMIFPCVKQYQMKGDLKERSFDKDRNRGFYGIDFWTLGGSWKK